MKIIIILILFTISVNCKFEDVFNKQFYSVSTFSSKILKIDESELIFYGYEGNILRTYNNGDTWLQNYSGTQQHINKLINLKNTIYGVTDSGNFMSSVDKGDWWKHIRLSDGFSDIVAINDNLYLSTKSDSLFVSSDFGNKWQKYKLNIDSILNIGSVGDYLIIHTINNKLYKLNALGDELELLNTPIQFNNIEVKKDKFYIKNETSISKLKNDYTWETFEFFAEARSFVFIEEADEFVIFAPNVSSRLNFGLDIFKFDKNKNKLNFIHKYFNNNFNLLAPSNFEMYPTDAIFSNGEYVLSNYYKTILTSSNLINWKIVINGSRKLIGNTLFYNNDYIYSQKVKKSNLIKSIDGGVTFKQSWDLIVETIDNKEYIPSIIDFKLKDANNGLILFDKIANNIDGNGVGISNRFMLFNNNEVKRLKHKIPDVFPSLNDVFIEDFIGNDYLVYSSYNVKKTIRNENNIYKDSIVRNVFYRLNENELDTLKSINDSIKKYNVLIKEDKVYLWGKTDIVDENNKSFTKFFYSSDSCKTINLLNIKPIEHLPNNQIVEPVTLLFDKNKNHYIITNKTIFVYDKEFNHIKNINTNSDLFNIRLNPTNFIEDAMFTGVKFKNGEIGDIEKQFYCYINDKIKLLR